MTPHQCLCLIRDLNSRGLDGIGYPKLESLEMVYGVIDPLDDAEGLFVLDVKAARPLKLGVPSADMQIRRTTSTLSCENCQRPKVDRWVCPWLDHRVDSQLRRPQP